MSNERSILNVYSGGVQIIVDSPDKITEDVGMTGQQKFDTCLNRTAGEVPITIRSCCSSIVRNGFRCIKRNVDFLSPSVCGPCQVYEPKIQDTQAAQT